VAGLPPPEPTLLFPDNTALVNFGYIDRYPLLERLANGHGAWCGTVAQECDDSAKIPGLSAMSSARSIFGSPWLPAAAEHSSIQILREKLAGPGDGPYAHLGEAETITILAGRRVKSIFVTDDNDATREAINAGLTVISTWKLLKVAVKQSLISDVEGLADFDILTAEKRGGRPCGASMADFRAWVSK
jgi:predicted nucleic acid-binding protein